LLTASTSLMGCNPRAGYGGRPSPGSSC
jgi:hypothetical protein